MAGVPGQGASGELWSHCVSWADLTVPVETGHGAARLDLGEEWPDRWLVSWRAGQRAESRSVRELARMPLASADPIRAFSWRRGQRHRPGLEYLVSTGRHHGFESLEEARTLLDLSPGAVVVLDGRQWTVQLREPHLGRIVLVGPDGAGQQVSMQCKPARYFVNSMSGLWHDAVDAEFVARVFAVVALAERHTFQILTKRAGRMHSVLASDGFWAQVRDVLDDYGRPSPAAKAAVGARFLPNLWLGVSVESQKWAVRLGKLAATMAGAVRFVSCEPLLGPLDLRPWLGSGLDWVIAGGESGWRARPMHPAWVRSLRDQCEDSGVPYFFKQRGQWTWDRGSGQPEPHVYVCSADGSVAGERAALADGGSWTGVWRVGKGRPGRLLDGRIWDKFPLPSQASVAVS